jgi:hypothetical protein
VRHPTYKHLEAKLRLGSFSLGQWAQITGAGVVAAVFGVYVSPFPTSVTIFISIVGAGMPVALSYGAMGLEFSVAEFAAAGWRYWREPRRYLPGGGQLPAGYLVRAGSVDELALAPPHPDTEHATDAEPLWDF